MARLMAAARYGSCAIKYPIRIVLLSVSVMAIVIVTTSRPMSSWLPDRNHKYRVPIAKTATRYYDKIAAAAVTCRLPLPLLLQTLCMPIIHHYRSGGCPNLLDKPQRAAKCRKKVYILIPSWSRNRVTNFDETWTSFHMTTGWSSAMWVVWAHTWHHTATRRMSKASFAVVLFNRTYLSSRPQKLNIKYSLKHLAHPFPNSTGEGGQKVRNLASIFDPTNI